MITYNWEKIKQLCNYDVINILHYFCYKQNMRFPQYLPREFSRAVFKEAMKPTPNGYSFICYLESLLINRDNANISEIYEYIDLASMRILFDYKVRSVTTLYYPKASEVDNKLLTIENNIIYFKYE